jgi:phosphoglucomutase
MAKKINEKGTICPLAIESSGHAAFKDNNFIDDGAYLAAKIIIEMVNLHLQGKTLNDLIKGLTDAKEQISIRIPVNDENPITSADKVLNDLKHYAESNKAFDIEKDNIEGVRIKFRAKNQNGWLLLRRSIHDPVMVLYVESYVSGGIKSILNLLKPFFKKYDRLDLSGIENYSSIKK